MKWHEIKTQADIDYLQKVYHDFEDSVLVSYTFISGNYVDEELVSGECNSNKLSLLFQRMDRNPFSIEIVFDYIKRFNFFAPVGATRDNWRSEIDFAKIAKNDEWFYWTKWREFDPCNEEHLNYNDFMLIEAQYVKWRVIK